MMGEGEIDSKVLREKAGGVRGCIIVFLAPHGSKE